MFFKYKIKNNKLKKMVIMRAKELGISEDELIQNYIGRGIMNDSINEEKFIELHSEEYMVEVNKTLGLE